MIAKRSLWAVVRLASRQGLITFSTRGGFTRESNDFDGMGSRSPYGAETESFGSSDHGRKKMDYNRREKVEFSPDTLAIFTDFSKSEAMEQIHRAKMDQTTEDFLLVFFDSIRSKKGYDAFGALSPEKRERFVDNLLLLIQDSLATQTRMSISQFTKITFTLLMSSDSIPLIRKLLENLFSLIKSIPIKYNIVNSFFLSCARKRNRQNSAELQECAELCQNTFFEILNDSRTRIDGRSIPGISHALSNCLHYMSDSNFKTEIKHLDFMVNHFLNLPIAEVPPMSLVLGYTSAANLIDSKRLDITLNNKDNMSYMENCISKYFPKEANKDHDGNDDDLMHNETINRALTGRFLNHFIQSMFLENEENWNYKNVLLHLYAQNTASNSFEDNFKRWVNKIFQVESFSFNSFHQWDQYYTIINLFLKGRSFHKLKMKLLVSSQPFLEKNHNIDRLVEMFAILFPFRSLIEGAPLLLNAKFDVEKEFSEEEKKVVREVFAFFKSKFLNEEKEINLRASIKIINYLKLEFESISTQELKETKLHKDMWARIGKMDLNLRILIDLLTIIPSYDIVRDTEIQSDLIQALGKIKDIQGLGRKRAKFSFYTHFMKIYELFAAEQDSLSAESRECFVRLTEIKNAMESA